MSYCPCGRWKEKPWKLACGRCWEKVPPALRDELWESFKAGDDSPRHRAATEACIDWIRDNIKPENQGTKEPCTQDSMH